MTGTASSTLRDVPKASVPVRHTRRRMDADAAPAAVPTQAPTPSSPFRVQRNGRGSGLPLQGCLKRLDDPLVERALHAAASFTLGPAPSNEPPAELRRLPGGQFLWDAVHNTPAAHVCRTTDPFPVVRLQCKSCASLQGWQVAGDAFCLHDPGEGAAEFSDSLQL